MGIASHKFRDYESTPIVWLGPAMAGSPTEVIVLPPMKRGPRLPRSTWLYAPASKTLRTDA